MEGNPDEVCPAVKWDPNELTWTDIPYGVAEARTVTLLNDCAEGDDLSLSLTVDGAHFSVSPTLASLAPGEIAEFTVTALLEEPGPVTGVLSAVTNDTANPAFDISLSATALGEVNTDGDGDGYLVGEDCNDEDAEVNPGETETWYDGVDQDCDGNDADQDADGFVLAEDCNDEDAAINPGESETWYDGTDQDCDGYDDDQDGDGYTLAEDCDDEDASVNPSETEVWHDGVDQDCDGRDEDADGDGFALAADCDDGDASISPDADEVWYDGIDQDCDGRDDDQDGDGFARVEDCDDEDATANPDGVETWYDGVDQDCDGNDDDQDGDGFAVSIDCDDEDAAINPDAPEIWYDGIDQDCDGASDYDQDGDGLDAVAYAGDDCNDTDPTTSSGTTEVYNGVDDDCDGEVDEGLFGGGEILIVEVMSNPALVADAYGEWFEVYNTTGTEIDLYDWVVSANDGQTFTITSSVPVAPYGFAVLGVDSDTTRNGGVGLDYAFARGSFSLIDADSIKLSFGSTLIDSVSWTLAWPYASGISMGLDPDRFATGSTVDDWCLATSAFGLGDLGTPAGENDACAHIDHDGDGYSVDDGDCDDAIATVYPGAFEAGDGLDTDCDGVEESAPTAVIEYNPSSEVTHCSPLQLDGSASTDHEGALLTFSWELTGAPATSALTSGSIQDQTDESPYFYPDVPGDYTFTLVVSDGVLESVPVSETIEVVDRGSNADPEVNAGADQSSSGSASCTADAYTATYECDTCSSSTFTVSASATDDDGDELTYSWAIASGTAYGTLTPSGATGARLVLSGAPATYGAATNTDVVLQATATDCYGATDTDLVTLTYVCTGS